VPLCTKKGRFPNVQQTCWELWHSVPDLMSGPSETLCHIKNPQEELGMVTATTAVRVAPLRNVTARKKGTRGGGTAVAYGLAQQRKSQRGKRANEEVVQRSKSKRGRKHVKASEV
jgi:hypothetical protein